MTTRTYAQPQSTGIQPHHFTDYLRVLHKRRWTATVAFLVVFVIGAIDTLKKTPIYQATAQLLIEKEARRQTNLNSVLDDQNSYFDDDFYPTQYAILTGRTLAWRAIESLGLAKPAAPAAKSETPAPPPNTSLVGSLTEWVSRAVGAPEKILPPPADETTVQSQMISGFLGGLSVQQLRQTRIFAVHYQSADPVRASVAANAVVDQYIRQSLDLRGEASEEASDYLRVELEKQRTKLNQSEAALAQYKETHDAIALDDKQNTVIQKLGDLNAMVTRAQQNRIDTEMKYKNLQSAGADREKLEAFPAILGNADIQKQKGQIRDLVQQRAKDAAQHGPKFQAVQALDQQIQQAQDKLYADEDKIVESAKNEYLTAQATEDAYRQQLDKQNREALALDRKGVEYAALLREAASNKTLYDTLLQRAKEIGVSGQFKGSNIRVLERAEIPRSPILPNRSRDLMVAFMQGTALALVLVFGFEYLDSRIKTPDDIKNHLGMPFLGLVPSIATKGKSADNLLLTGDVPAGFSEAIRAVRTAVIFSSADEGARTIVITSTAPSEGKTLVSTNLAVALAQADQRTLIVDGDMRRPRVHGVFGRNQEPGLSNVLVGTSQISDAVRVTAIPNLYVMPSGHIPPNPAELLGSIKYIEVLEELRQKFDWILIDAPPVMAVTDAAILSHSATGVIFVVGAEMTSRRNAIAAVDQLLHTRAKFIGAVLNRVNLARNSYYYSPYYRKDYTQAYHRSHSA
jgi:capsular exopolysaccharide synthesis family protein